MDDIRLKQLPALEILEFHENADAGDLASESSYEIATGNKGSTCCNEVIDYEHPLRGPDRIGMYLERACSILQ